MRYMLVILMLIVSSVCFAGHVKIKGKIVNPDAKHYELSLFKNDISYPLSSGNESGEYDVEVDEDAFFTLAGVAGDKQIIGDIFVESGKEYRIDLEIGQQGFEIHFDDSDKMNRMMQEFGQYLNDQSKALWEKEVTGQDLKDFFDGYQAKMKLLIQTYRPVERLERYLKISGYVAYVQSVDGLRYTAQRAGRDLEIPAEIKERMEPAEKVLDHEDALNKYSTLGIIYQSVSEGQVNMEEQLARLQTNYKTPSIVEKVTDMVLQDFMRRYNYNVDFEQGLERLKKVTASMGKRGRAYINTFMARKYTLVGAELPDVMLQKTDGTKISLKSLAGENKIIYVDCWASWCVPCCREVPYLQALEHELQGEDILFVSISSDQKRELWIKKMEQLSVTETEHQYLDADGAFSEIMNITSIPHFLIYGKDGRLKVYKAPRPSDSETLKELFKKL